jgi:hercynylcysteine S-oxide lyase
VAGAGRYEQDEANYAARVGLATAAQEHQALGPPYVYARLAGIGRAARGLLNGVAGWQVAEPVDEPTAIVTLRPPERHRAG